MGRFYDLEVAGGRLSVKKNRKALSWKETIDGMLILETTDLEQPAEGIVKRSSGASVISVGRS
jgi:hypothetical protein